MRKKRVFVGLVRKGQLIICLLAALFVLSSSVAMQRATATETQGGESMDFCIVIDPGHGGVDPGSIGYKTKVKESSVNLAVSLKLAERLEGVGARVVMTRKDEGGLYGLSTVNYKKRDMQKRKEIIEAARPDIVVSVHMNSYVRHNLRGAQVFYDKSSPRGEALALAIQDQFAEKLESSSKGVAVGDYFMLKCTPSASVIAECGFLSNEQDEKLLTTPEYQDKIADCIFFGIVNFLNGE